MILKRIQSVLLRRGINFTRAISEADVAAFVARCAPVPAGCELVRIGPDGDGGYLVPDDFDGLAQCFSPGVNDQSGFELDLAARGIRSYLADASVAVPPQPHPLFDFEPRFIGAVDDGRFMTLDSWVASKAPQGVAEDSLLQMDIETWEYPALLAVSDATLKRFRTLVIEFHHLNRLFDPVAFLIMRACFDKLLALFDVVHLHPNNSAPAYRYGSVSIPGAMEFTLHRKGRIARTGPRPTFPHVLDRECDARKPVLVLPACWQQGS